MRLTVENGGFYYNKDTKIFENINFSVESGEILAILGPNGAGKTTLLRCITGMLKWKNGRSTLDGESIAGMRTNQLWKKMAYVPQAKNVSSSYTAMEMVLLGRSSHLNPWETPKKEDVNQAKAALELLGIQHLTDKKCSAISGGELQMVLIARALASNPKVLILDEPESNLDFKNQLVVLGAITQLANQGMTCVFNTHYPAHALQRANKALILSKGGEYIFGETHEVVTEENIEKAFGVKTVIGTIETKESMVKDVLPLDVSGTGKCDPKENRRRIATITIISNNNEKANQINNLLHEYGEMMIGRMGMPYKPCGLYIINITLDGMEDQIESLAHKLTLLAGVSVKVTYAQGEF